MHNAHRRLQILSCCSRVIDHVRSILPGCSRAISFTKALFKRSPSKLAREQPVVNHIIYVDDFGKQPSGILFEVAYVLAAAAVCFVFIAARPCLAPSSKKRAAILASHPIIEQIISLRLARCRAPCRIVSSHRDLGIQFAIGRGGVPVYSCPASKRLSKDFIQSLASLSWTGLLANLLAPALCLWPSGDQKSSAFALLLVLGLGPLLLVLPVSIKPRGVLPPLFGLLSFAIQKLKISVGLLVCGSFPFFHYSISLASRSLARCV